MPKLKARAGQIVMFNPGTHDQQPQNKFSDVIPAVVTRVHGASVVNLHVFIDGPGPIYRPNIKFKKDAEKGESFWDYADED